MKRLLTILLVLSIVLGYGQDAKPTGRIPLQSPINVTWDYNSSDQTIGMSKGAYKWNKFFSAKKVQFLIDSLDIIKQNKATIIPYTYYTPLRFINNFFDITKNSNVLFIGDSNYDSADRLMKPLLKSFIKYRKSRGVGYFSFSTGTETMGLKTHVRTGTWTDKDIFSGGEGIDGRSTFSNIANSEITIETNSLYVNNDLSSFDELRVYYKQTGSAGTIAYSINNGSYTNVVLGTSSGTLGAFDINTGSVSSSWIIKIKLVSGEVTLLGGNMSNVTGRGSVVHKAAHSGAASIHYSTLSSNSIWLSEVQDINPDIVFIGLTTNDFTHNIGVSTTLSRMNTLVDNLKTYLPNAAIYIISPPRCDEAIVAVTDHTALANNTMLFGLAESEKIGFISLFDAWIKHQDSYVNTLFSDGIHYNSNGAIINSDIITSYLFPKPYLKDAIDLQSVTDNGNTTKNDIYAKDFIASRGNTGVYYLTDAKNRYLYYDGVQYVMPSSELYVANNNLVYNTGNANKNSVDWKTNTLKVGDDQSTNNPILYLYGGTGSAASSRTASLQVDPIYRNLNIGSWNAINFYSNVANENAPTTGTLALALDVDGSARLPLLASAKAHLLSSTTTGKIDTVANGAENQVLKIVSGVPAFADESGGIITPQNLSGTTITYNAANGANANITLSGNTTINMSNVQAGMVGNITIINDGTARQLTFSGYTFKISLKIRGGTNMAWSSATGIDKFSWDYDGTRLSITGEYNLQ